VGDLLQPMHIIVLLVVFAVVISVLRLLKGGGRLGSILVLTACFINRPLRSGCPRKLF